VRPEVTSGRREGSLAFAGASSGVEVDGRMAVCDIGGGSTEIVTEDHVISVDIGSVRLTDRVLTDRPPAPGQVDEAFDQVGSVFTGVDPGDTDSLVGVAGTWTSLAAISRGLAGEDPVEVHGMFLEVEALEGLFDQMLSLTAEETAALPGLDPRRAPVILSGALIAVVVSRRFETDAVVISERDSLDGLAAELLALP
jgi:exopolyphosphatase / guanosine-5'-triphosphate,3'-diphosphate pyrophosphatase